jgi:hypothetical protein
MKSRSAAIFASLFVAGCGANTVESISPPATPIDPQQTVVIVKKPLYVQHGTFVENQNAHSSKGLTEWFFHCYPEFKYSVSSKPLAPNEVTIAITKVTLTISCPITVRIGRQEKLTIDHENGHVEIVKEIYADAGKAAKKACTSIIGKQFSAKGENAADATAGAVDLAAQEVCRHYTEKTVSVANELSKNYDEITQHGHAKIPIPQAIQLSKEKFKRFNH